MQWKKNMVKLDNNNDKISTSLLYSATILILSLIATRLISLGLFPLYDTTEARYGEMARIMAETNNWITPQFDYNVPFWGKPPFQTWLSALSFSWFGVSEITARIPHFLCGLITCALIFRFTKSLTNNNSAIFSLLIITSSLGFILAIGMVMTDSALLMANTIAMVSFWQCYRQKDKALSGHLFFVALALGMLIKGPVAVVLIGIALVCWSVWQKCFWDAIKSLPWLSGMLLLLTLILPWYIAAEIRTPGFLEYFILGEHIQRFLVSGWQGDLYGSAHVKPRGMIWLYWVICACPWSFIALGLIVKRYRGIALPHSRSQTLGINKYLICWMISPLLLFTLAGNILPIYVLPGFSALAVLIAINSQLKKRHNYLASFTLVTIISIVILLNTRVISNKSEAYLLGSDRSFKQNVQLYYWKKRPFSAQFYSKGQAQLLDDAKQINNLLASNDGFLLAIKRDDFEVLQNKLSTVCLIEKQNEARILLKCN